MVKICSDEDAHSSEELTLVIENEDGERCTTTGLDVSRGKDLISFSPRQFGENCSRFKVTSTTTVMASNPGNDNLCLTHLLLDTVEGASGRGRVQVCRYDKKDKFNINIQGNFTQPLICRRFSSIDP